MVKQLKPYRPIFVLTLLVFVLYLPFLGNAFVSDDIQGIVEQAASWNWLTALGWPHFIHLGTFGHFIIYHLAGLHPWAFRLVNILFHLGSSILVYLIGYRLVRSRAALVGAVIFAIHPLAIESVTWISGGAYTQYTFWFLLSFFWYLRGRRGYLWSVISFLFSIFTSEKALPLALIFLLYMYVSGTLKKKWGNLIPYFVLSCSLILFYASKISERTAALSMGAIQTTPGLMNPVVQIPVAVSSYLQLFVAPVGLTLYHSELTFLWWDFAIRALVTIGFLGAGVYAIAKRKLWGLWVWWVFIGLLSTLTPLKVGWIVAERYVYCSLVGLSILTGILFDYVVSKKKWYVATLCAGVLFGLFLCTQTVFRNSQWRTEDTLWIATAATSPSHPPTWNNMGDVYARRGDLPAAAAAFSRAIALNPQYADAYHNLGHTYLRMGELAEAKLAYEQALAIHPNLWQSYRDLAVISYEEGDMVKAKAFLSRALLLAPQDATLLHMQRLLQ